MRELNAQLTNIHNMLDNEKKSGNEPSQLQKAADAQFWWACPVDRMNRAQLELFKKVLDELKKLVAQHVDRIVTSSVPALTLPFFLGNASSSNIPFHHRSNPQQAQIFLPQIFWNLMLQPHLSGFNNMGRGGYGPLDSLKF